jgi:8-oxo-dGTP diphosphatase
LTPLPWMGDEVSGSPTAADQGKQHGPMNGSMVMSDLIKAAILIKENDKFLLVQEKGQRARGLWNWPQGRVEDGETYEQAARREAKEETGLYIVLERKIAVMESTFPDTKEIHVYLGRVAGGELTIAEDEVLDARYFTAGEIRDMKKQLVGEWIAEAVDESNR